MKAKLFQNKLVVKKSTMHGYGVFAEKTLKKGEMIEECYVIISKGGDKTLEDYYFDAKGKYALFTGFGSIYNHSVEPNADYTIHIKNKIATLKAANTIKKGEEIFVSYGDEWFSSRGMKAKSAKPVKNNKKTKKK
jgi:SET domain-containing protein